MPYYLDPTGVPQWAEGEQPKRVQFNEAFEKLNKTFGAIDSEAIARAEAASKSAVTSAQGAQESARIAVESKTFVEGQAALSKTEADRAKREADRAAEIVGGNFVTRVELESGVTEAKTYTNTAQAELEERVTGYTDSEITGAKEYTNTAIQALQSLIEQLPKKSTLHEAVLLASDWLGAFAPFTQTIMLDGVTETSVQEVLLSLHPTDEEIACAQKANLHDAGQAVGSFNLEARGEKPGIDLPVRIILRGDM